MNDEALQKEHDEHGQGKWEGNKQKGKSDMESKARQKEALHCAPT
jgi:hypothetical protein